MADPQKQQQQILEGYDVQPGNSLEHAADPPIQSLDGYDVSYGNSVSSETGVPPVKQVTPPPGPEKSWGPRAVEAIGSVVPESAPAAAQKVQETVGSAVPEWSIRPLAAFQKYVNEPLDAAAAWGAKKGRQIALEELTSQDPERQAQGIPATTSQAEKKYPVMSGVLGTAGEMAGGMIADPRAWPMLGSGAARPLIQKALSGGFGVMMSKDAADAATELSATWDDITPEQRAQLAARAGLSGVMATAAAAHFAGPENVGKVVKGAKRLGGDLMRGEEGADLNLTPKAKKAPGAVTGTEQYEPKNLPRAKGSELPAAADRAPYVEPTPAGPEPGLVGPDYTEVEPDVLPRQGKLKFPQIPRMEYAEPTPVGPGPEIATGKDQFDIRNLPKTTGAEPVAEPKSTGPKTPYGTIDIESMPVSESGFPEAKVEEKPITREDVKSTPGTSMGEERRAAQGERRQSTEPYEGEERRKAERRASLMSPTEAEAALKTGKPVKTAFDVTEGAMDTIKRDQAMPKHPAEEAKTQSDNVVKHIEAGKDFAILQAENPQNTRISDAENAKLTAQLKQELIDKGYKPVEVGGNTKDVAGVQEHAFFVPDISAEDAAELGRKYQQQGIVTHEGLRDLNTNKVDPLDLSKGLLKGDEARKQQYYTTIGGEDYHFPMKEGEAQNPVRTAAENVNKGLGKDKINNEKVELDPRRNEIADAYDAMKHDPKDPKVKAAYDALIKETVDQFHRLKEEGYKIAPTSEDPYKTYEDMANDVKNKKLLKVWTGAEPPADHPLSGTDPETGLSYNTIFRFVHDIMGHVAGDNDFSEKGEENAWKRHSQSYSDNALPAMTTETKGQTSTFFNGKDVREGAAPHFPDQKAGLLPEEFYKGTPKEVTKNASGESAASQEAINRTQSQKEQGIKTYRVDTRSGKATPVSGVEAADAKANPYEKIVQVKGDQVTEQDSGKGARPLDEKKLLESVKQDTDTAAAQEKKLKETAKPDRDTKDILQKVQNEPEWKDKTLSEQLMEAGRRAQKAEQAGPETEAGGDHYSTVEGHVGDLSNNNLKALAKAVGIDPDKYDFSKRVPLREGGQKHPVERQQLVKDIMTKLTPEQIEQLGNQAETAKGENVGGEPARSQKARAADAEQLFKEMLGKDTQFTGKGPAPEATPETAKMSDAELKQAGFTQADIDAGKHIPKVGGGGEGEATKMAGMEKIPENITKQFRDDEIAGLKTEKSQEKAAQQLMKVPAVQEWIDVANLGAGERKWYQRGTAAAKAIAELLPKFFDKEGDTDKFLNVVAALSPRQAITENFTEALRVWKELKEAEKSGIDLTEKMTTRRPAGYPKNAEWNQAGKILWDNIGINRSAKVPNALAALSGKSALEMWPDLSKNTNFKVPSFAANLAGFLDKVTSDGWMAAFAGIGDKELKNPSSYHPLAVMTRAAAEELGWEPAEAQAAIWAAVKTLTEKGTVTPEGIRQYSQDFANIVQTDTQIREMLQDMGVDLKELDGKLGKIEERPEVTSRGTPTTEDSVRKLTQRLEKQGREIPQGTPIEREQDAARIRELSSKGESKLGKAADEDTSFNPDEFEQEKQDEKPITDTMIKKYGTTEEPYTPAQFITADGKRIPVQDHDVAVQKALGKKTLDYDDRMDYINNERAVRMRTRSGRTASKEVVFSIPEDGDVSADQIKAMKETVKKMGPYGMAYIEGAKAGGNYVTMTNPTPADVDSAIKEYKRPKRSEVARFHAMGDNE